MTIGRFPLLVATSIVVLVGAVRPARAADGCYERCLRRSATQAVSWEAIEAQCRGHCGHAARPQPRPRSCRRDTDCRVLRCCCAHITLGPRQKAPKRCTAPCACPKILIPRKPRCEAGACTLNVERPAAAAPRVAGPPLELSPDNAACRRDRDCALLPSAPCGCPPCPDNPTGAANRRYVRWLRGEYAKEQCPRPVPPCVPCRRASARHARHAACVKGRCAMRPPKRSPPSQR